MRPISALMLALLCVSPAAAETIRFSGELRAGESFERRLPRGLMFCLLPGGEDGKESWTISIARTCSPKEDDFASIATPPYRGAHPRFIEAWHFLPDTKLFSNTREFRFVLNELDHARILGMLQNQQHHEAAEILTLAAELGKGAGTVEITGAEISPAEDPLRTKFIRLRFRVKLEFPARP
jgi:hypothetical protein